MARKEIATPAVEGDDLERFIKKLNEPPSYEEAKFLKEADEVFKKIKFVE